MVLIEVWQCILTSDSGLLEVVFVGDHKIEYFSSYDQHILQKDATHHRFEIINFQDLI